MLRAARTRIGLVKGAAIFLPILALCGPIACSADDTSPAGDGGNGTCPPQTSPPLMCTPGVSPAKPAITDFTEGQGWCASSGKWGATGNLVGSVFTYKGTVEGTTISHTVTAGALHLMGDVMAADYAGGGLAFDACVNTRAYSGVQLTLGGNAAGCTVYLQVQTYSQQATENRGGCSASAGSCYQFPKSILPTAGGGPTTVRWSELEATGMPATADAIAAEIVGLQFQLQAESGTACTGFDVSIDDVQLVP